MAKAKLNSKLAETIFVMDSEYTGEVTNEEAHGYGTAVDENTLYEGLWHENEKHGWGTQTTQYQGLKFFYAGQWELDCQHGQGVFTWSDGTRYVGGF